MPLYRGFGKRPSTSTPPAEPTRRISRPDSPANKSGAESLPNPPPSTPVTPPDSGKSSSPLPAEQTRRIARSDSPNRSRAESPPNRPLSTPVTSSDSGKSSSPLPAEQTRRIARSDSPNRSRAESPPAARIPKASPKPLIAQSVPGLPSSVTGQGVTPDLVVGLLAIIAGPGRSALLTLGYGVNDIGRGAGARVRLDYGDASVALENQAAITYSMRSRRFYLQSVAAEILLNGQAVRASTELSGGETLQIGQTHLRFIPLCGRDFDWLGDK